MESFEITKSLTVFRYLVRRRRRYALSILAKSQVSNTICSPAVFGTTVGGDSVDLTHISTEHERDLQINKTQPWNAKEELRKSS